MWLLWGEIGIRLECSYLSNLPGRGSLQCLAGRRFGDGLQPGCRKVGVNRGWNIVLVHYAIVVGSHPQGRPPRVVPLVHGYPDRLASEI